MTKRQYEYEIIEITRVRNNYHWKWIKDDLCKLGKKGYRVIFIQEDIIVMEREINQNQMMNNQFEQLSMNFSR